MKQILQYLQHPLSKITVLYAIQETNQSDQQIEVPTLL